MTRFYVRYLASGLLAGAIPITALFVLLTAFGGTLFHIDLEIFFAAAVILTMVFSLSYWVCGIFLYMFLQRLQEGLSVFAQCFLVLLCSIFAPLIAVFIYNHLPLKLFCLVGTVLSPRSGVYSCSNVNNLMWEYYPAGLTPEEMIPKAIVILSLTPGSFIFVRRLSKLVREKKAAL